jgi:pyrroline-5-carboxylate reductase
MAEAYLRAMDLQKFQSPKDTTIVDVNEPRLEYLKKTYGVNTTLDINHCLKDADIILLSCKPQSIKSIASSITTPITGHILSIVAGANVKELQESFKTKKIIRCMPNTPAAVIEGMTVWYASPDSDADVVKVCKNIMESTGDAIKVSEEVYLDMATAVSGSGPAYVFLTMEAMVDAAVHVGFPRHIATRLVIQTLKGSVAYAEQSAANVQELRNNVTSPGGTTASALYELERGGFRTVVADAVWAGKYLSMSISFLFISLFSIYHYSLPS